MRDELDNLLIANRAGSAILVKQGEVELYSFNSFLSSQKSFDKNGSNANFHGKLIQFASQLQVNFGVSKSRRINVGADLLYSAYRHDVTTSNSVFSIFNNDPSTVKSATYAGVRLRLQPFKRVYNFSYQTYVWFPIASEQRRYLLGSSKMNWGNTFFYYKYFNQKFGLFAQANLTFAFPSGDSTRLGEDENKTEFYLPLNLTASYVVAKKNIFYASIVYSRINKNVSQIMEGADSDFMQYGIGYQRIFTKRLFANINYNGTIMARNYGSWDNLTLGIRYRF
jgi:hypothetical protein